MKKITLWILVLMAFSCTTSQKSAQPEPEVVKKPTNVILLIGDGMGLTQITAGMYRNGNKIAFERMPVVGLHKQHASNNLVTDSAAGATAFSCGVKTYNGAIGVDAKEQPVETILEMAEKEGMATGLIATSTITHATPGSFIGHVKQRKQQEDIAAYFLKTEIDLFIGGGKKYFDRREDKRDLITELKQKGYVVHHYAEKELNEITMPKEANFGYLTADESPLPLAQGRDYLLEASKKSLDFLNKRSDKGFFLMLEGSQIDWGGHANDSEYIITEMLEFNKVVNQVLDFAEKDGNTLVIVTADHETGGYSINYGSTMDSLVTKFTTDYHTATMIPVFATGPGCEAFSGIYENIAIFDKMKNAMDL